MSLDKSIEHGYEHREQYRGAKSVDPTCRNHGGCQWCEHNRTHGTAVRAEKAEEQIKEAMMMTGEHGDETRAKGEDSTPMMDIRQCIGCRAASTCTAVPGSACCRDNTRDACQPLCDDSVYEEKEGE